MRSLKGRGIKETLPVVDVVVLLQGTLRPALQLAICLPNDDMSNEYLLKATF